MRVIGQSEDGDSVIVELTQAEAQLLGCLELAWSNQVAGDGPPGSFWFHNVHISDALRAVAAFTEVLARSNGLQLALDEVNKVLRSGELADGD